MRRDSESWTHIGLLKRYDGNGWVDVSTARIYNGAKWAPLWRPSGTYSSTYTLSAYASYNMKTGARVTGIPLTNGLARIRQGSPNGSADSIVSTMMFFPADRIFEDLYGSQIVSVHLEIKKVGSGTSKTCLLIHYGGGYSSCPAAWKGSDKGDADPGTPAVQAGQTATILLNNRVAEGLRDGTATFLSLNASELADARYYGDFDASSVKLHIQYKYK